MSHVKMRPYGIRSEYRDEAFGPTTKFSGSMRSRRKWRRLMHRQGRIDGRAEVESQIQDLEQEELHGCGCVECQAKSTHSMYCECPECDHWSWWWRNGEPERVEIPQQKPAPSWIGAEIAKALIQSL